MFSGVADSCVCVPAMAKLSGDFGKLVLPDFNKILCLDTLFLPFGIRCGIRRLPIFWSSNGTRPSADCQPKEKMTMFSRIRKHIANPRTTGLCKTGLALAAIMSLGLGDAPPAPAQSVTVLYSFSGSDGAYPYTPLVEASDGNFYGTTYYGGNNGGTVYQVTPSGALTTLYAFAGTSDPNGSQPMA